MSETRYRATRTFAALALAAIPTLALAQAAQPIPAADHLAAARTALNRVLNAPMPAGDMFKRVADLKTEYLLLERAASTASPEWFAHYTMIDRLVGEMLGPLPSSSGPRAVGTSGRSGSATGSLEAGAAADLQDFRTHLMAFSATMSAVAAGGQPPAVPAPPPAPTGPPPSANPSAAARPPFDADTDDVTALVDQVTALVDGALGVGAPANDTVSVDRAMLERIKGQLERIKQRVSKP